MLAPTWTVVVRQVCLLYGPVSGLRVTGDARRAAWPGFHGPADDDVHELSTALMRAVTAAADQAKGETTVLFIDGA